MLFYYNEKETWKINLSMHVSVDRYFLECRYDVKQNRGMHEGSTCFLLLTSDSEELSPKGVGGLFGAGSL